MIKEKSQKAKSKEIMPISDIKIVSLQPEDVPRLIALTEGELSELNTRTYFTQCFEAHQAQERLMFLALDSENSILGYVQYNKFPLYKAFQNHAVPEIQDLFVIPEKRRQGIAQKLISHCESLARKEGRKLIGIGVGLLKSYGAAQILYNQLGYHPDGAGLVYNREPVTKGTQVCADDDLCLMMIKHLD